MAWQRRARARGIAVFGCAASVLALTASGAAMAQEAPRPNAQAITERAGANPGDIVVTAQRREQRLQDVPVAVTALSSDSLRNLQARDIGDIQGAVPNLTLHEGDASNAVVYIRGVGQIDSLAFADPGVGVYVDDVYLGRAQGAFLSVYDVDRIEVLRGPQGTLYGRNTIGGAVKFVSTPLSKRRPAAATTRWSSRAASAVRWSRTRSSPRRPCRSSGATAIARTRSTERTTATSARSPVGSPSNIDLPPICACG